MNQEVTLDSETTIQEELEFNDENSQYDRIQPILDEVLEKYGEEGCYVYLYKQNKNRKGGYEQVDKYQTFILPDSHDIGINYGGGTYYIWINFKDKDGKKKSIKRSFSLGSSYDRLCAKNEMEERNQLNGSSAVNGGSGSMVEILKMMQEESRRNNEMLIEAIKESKQPKINMIENLVPFVPVITQFVKNMGRAPQNDNSELVQMLMKQNMDNASAKMKEITDVFHKGIEIGGMAMPGQEESSPVDAELIKELVPLATMFLSRWQRPVANTAVKQNPKIVEKLSRPENYTHFVSELIREHGIEKTQQILGVSGLEQPEHNPPELSAPIEKKTIKTELKPEKKDVPETISI